MSKRGKGNNSHGSEHLGPWCREGDEPDKPGEHGKAHNFGTNCCREDLSTPDKGCDIYQLIHHHKEVDDADSRTVADFVVGAQVFYLQDSLDKENESDEGEADHYRSRYMWSAMSSRRLRVSKGIPKHRPDPVSR